MPWLKKKMMNPINMGTKASRGRGGMWGEGRGMLWDFCVGPGAQTELVLQLPETVLGCRGLCWTLEALMRRLIKWPAATTGSFSKRQFLFLPFQRWKVGCRSQCSSMSSRRLCPWHWISWGLGRSLDLLGTLSDKAIFENFKHCQLLQRLLLRSLLEIFAFSTLNCFSFNFRTFRYLVNSLLFYLCSQ